MFGIIADRWICISQNFKERRARAAHSDVVAIDLHASKAESVPVDRS
jgi:hypothetical protein